MPQEKEVISGGSQRIWIPAATRSYPLLLRTTRKKPTIIFGGSGHRCPRRGISRFLIGAGTDVFWLSGWRGSVPKHNGGGRIVKSTPWSSIWSILERSS